MLSLAVVVVAMAWRGRVRTVALHNKCSAVTGVDKWLGGVFLAAVDGLELEIIHSLKSSFSFLLQSHHEPHSNWTGRLSSARGLFFVMNPARSLSLSSIVFPDNKAPVKASLLKHSSPKYHLECLVPSLPPSPVYPLSLSLRPPLIKDIPPKRSPITSDESRWGVRVQGSGTGLCEELMSK